MNPFFGERFDVLGLIRHVFSIARKRSLLDLPVGNRWPCQFLPAIFIVAGAFLAAFGGFWQAVRQSQFNAELRQKNDKIIELQHQSAGAITGGDSFAETASVVLQWTEVSVGSLTPGFARANGYASTPFGKAFQLQCSFRCTERRLDSTAAYEVDGQGWSVATRIFGLSEGKELYRRVTPDYPLGPNSEVEWEEKPSTTAAPQQ